ncbi:hypothetical protein M3Y96_00531300 [Aphelenchoides besseyi]|nr:hypothetical protein M3Y96_00531300 [Aphelenchoides besseyi]
MYCEPVCVFKISTKYSACNPKTKISEPNQYSLTDSKSFHLLNKTRWNSRTWFANLLSGNYFRDKLVFVADELVQTTNNLEIQDAVMVDGTLLDQNLFIDASALVGFGPGENNIVSQLYARNLIPFPIIHIVLPSLYLRNGLLKIGDYGYDTCVNWTHHATQHYNRWVLEVRNLEVNGVQYKKQVKARFYD